MSETVSDEHARAATTPGAGEGGEEYLSYEGAVVPWFVVLLWLGFIAFSVIYLLRFVPESWMEWFAGE